MILLRGVSYCPSLQRDPSGPVWRRDGWGNSSPASRPKPARAEAARVRRSIARQGRFIPPWLEMDCANSAVYLPFGVDIERELHFVLDLKRTGCGLHQLDAVVALLHLEAPGGAQHSILHRQIGGQRVVLGNTV